jgi:hypothetical protein
MYILHYMNQHTNGDELINKNNIHDRNAFLQSWRKTKIGSYYIQ